MKNTILVISTLVLIFACKKNNSNNPPPTGSLLTSIRSTNFSEHSLLIDSFSYDDHKNITRIIQWEFDSTQSEMLTDSTVWKFTYAGANNNPSSYTTGFYYSAVTSAGFTEDHTLFYDNQGRIIFDTAKYFSVSGDTVRANYYKYTSSYIVANQTPGFKDATDTMFLNNGNVIKHITYGDTLGIGTFDLVYSYTYANTPNPLYKASFAAGIGPLLLKETYLDFVSKDLPATSKEIFYTSDLGYTYTTNSSGLPTKGLAKDRTTGELVRSITYNYQ